MLIDQGTAEASDGHCVAQGEGGYWVVHHRWSCPAEGDPTSSVIGVSDIPIDKPQPGWHEVSHTFYYLDGEEVPTFYAVRRISRLGTNLRIEYGEIYPDMFSYEDGEEYPAFYYDESEGKVYFPVHHPPPDAQDVILTAATLGPLRLWSMNAPSLDDDDPGRHQPQQNLRYTRDGNVGVTFSLGDGIELRPGSVSWQPITFELGFEDSVRAAFTEGVRNLDPHRPSYSVTTPTGINVSVDSPGAMTVTFRLSSSG